MTDSRHNAVHDPEGLLDRLPLDREPQLALAEAVLRWNSKVPAPEPPDMELMALQLTGHARLVVEQLRMHAGKVGEETSLRMQLDILLHDADRHLAVMAPERPSVAHTQGRARLLISLYQGMDKFDRNAQGSVNSS
ncbi:restriction endonuclease [Streptomyces sp. NPDC085639]|uniref:restriction endonuclease n=1 Tax=Streptomyces sp. NPDC085639 TaxID=3365734 RepID=UPI0037D0EBBE